jgi:Uma2 family endonuclease
MRIVLDSKRLVTAEEFWRMPKGDAHHDYRWELLEGRVVRMSLPGARHGVITARIASLFAEYARHTQSGVAAVESGCLLTRNPDTVVGPDVSFMCKPRIPKAGVPVRWWDFAPDLIVEIISPDNRMSELRPKLARYLNAGARVAWVVEPDDKTVTVYRLHSQPQTLGIGDTLEGGDVLPGFSCAVAEFFAGL